MELWRISNHLSLNGEGGRRAPARWHSAGQPIVYLAESPAWSLLEVLVHLELLSLRTPRTYTLLRIAAPDLRDVPVLPVPQGEDWKGNEPLTQSLGDLWLQSRQSALARVPSAILPRTFNFLLNPLHPDAAEVKIVESVEAPFDPRLLRKHPTF